MQRSTEIGNGIYWLGVNDRRKELFENIWPIPQGVSYNSYLIVDERTALLDTMESGADGSYIRRIEELLGGRQLDYLIVNHMELDHAGEIAAVVRRWPGVKVIGNNKTFTVLRAYFDTACDNIEAVADGDTLSLGEHELKFVFTPWVHWPETMMTYESTEKILFSADAFGTFGTIDGSALDTGLDFSIYESEMRRYYSNIVGKYSGFVQKALAKLAGVEVRTICSLHGPVWRENVAKVVGLYDKWSRYEADDAVVVIYASMYGNTARMADYIAGRIADAGARNIRVYDVSKTHISYLISEIWRCKSVVLGSCAYNAEMFPLMERLCTEMKHMGVKNKKLAIFGTYSWNGGGVRNLAKFAEEIGWEKICEPAEIHGAPGQGKYEVSDMLGNAVAMSVMCK